MTAPLRSSASQVPGAQFAHALANRVGKWDVIVLEEEPQAGRVEAARQVGMGEERLHFRAEQEEAVGVVPVERLDADAVAAEDQPLLAVVPQGDGPHATEAIEGLGTPRHPGLEDHLGVTVGAEGAAGSLQFLPQRGVVVDLAVEDHVVAAVGGGHGLVAQRAQLDDGQPAVAEGDGAVGENGCPGVIRPAGLHGVAQAFDEAGQRPRLGATTVDDADYAAHGSSPIPAMPGLPPSAVGRGARCARP